MTQLERGVSPDPSSKFTERTIIVPKVTYAQELEDAPYRMSFDPEKFAGLLREELGFSNDQISQLSVSLIRRDPDHSSLRVLGSYHRFKAEITFYGDTMWRNFYEKNLHSADRIISSRGEKKGKIKGLRSPNRFSRYLAAAPQERAREFAKKHLLKSLNTQVGSVVLHEAKHATEPSWYHKANIAERISKLAAVPIGNSAFIGLATDGESTSYRVFAVGAVLTAGVMLDMLFLLEGSMFSSVDSMEYRAKKFAMKNERRPEYKDILTLSLRDS